MGLQQKFVTQGQFLAMPLGFPSVSTPPSPDDCHVTSVAVAKNGLFTAGVTRGCNAYGFWAFPKAVGGFVLTYPLGDGLNEGVKVVDCGEQVVIAANGGTEAVVQKIQVPALSDGIQEWSFAEQAPATIARFPGERISCAAGIGGYMVCSLDRRTIVIDLNDGGLKELKCDLQPSSMLPLDTNTLLTATCDGSFAIINPAVGTAVPLHGKPPAFVNGGFKLHTFFNGLALGVETSGALWLADPATGRMEQFGEAPLPPVQTLAALPDGRCMGFCGEGIGRFFEVHLKTRQVKDLGVAVATIGVRRYAFSMSCAAVGPDGEIYFGEDDRGGHLWLYFPPISSYAV